MLDPVRRLGWRAWRVFDRWNERRFGVKTSGQINPEDLGLPSGENYRGGLYIPSPWLILRFVFRALRVTNEDVFVDYGSGMGRVLIFAARQPFKRVIGIEMVEDHNRLARENIERNRDRFRCQDIELVTGRAEDWRVPDDLTIAYLYAPFPPHLFGEVLRQLFASLDRRPRPLRLVYYFMAAPDREVILNTGRARLVKYKEPWYLRKRLTELWIFELS